VFYDGASDLELEVKDFPFLLSRLIIPVLIFGVLDSLHLVVAKGGAGERTHKKGGFITFVFATAREIIDLAGWPETCQLLKQMPVAGI
jgi:hypothetical protein